MNQSRAGLDALSLPRLIWALSVAGARPKRRETSLMVSFRANNRTLQMRNPSYALERMVGSCVYAYTADRADKSSRPPPARTPVAFERLMTDGAEGPLRARSGGEVNMRQRRAQTAEFARSRGQRLWPMALEASTRPSPLRPPAIWRQRRPPVTTAVGDSYWKLAAERQAIFFARVRQQPPPWTADPILQEHKFTNAYRASDRTSQYLIREVIYSGDQSVREVTFRTLLFKLFNRIETWQTIVRNLGQPSAGAFDPREVGALLSAEHGAGARIYSAAYIMPPLRGTPIKHSGHLNLLGAMLRANLAERVADAADLGSVFGLLAEWPSFGRFLAYQLAIDLNYAGHMAFDEDDFVIAGPGAREGIAKCFSSRDGWTDEELIRWTADQQETAFERRGLRFADLWGRCLRLIDVQNLYCETAKYARRAHPEFTAAGGRSRIKQRFVETGPLRLPWYPPKWGLNDRISVGLENEPPVHEIELKRAALANSQLAPDLHAD
jgi:hypothetical protein